MAEARAAFTARLAPPGLGCPRGAPAPLEDGEIREGAAGAADKAAEREQRIFAGINLALLEALGQNGAAALAACNLSLIAAAGAITCPSSGPLSHLHRKSALSLDVDALILSQ